MDQEQTRCKSRPMRIAVEGCGHGTLDAIYTAVENACVVKGWDGVDVLIICGDFQAVRDRRDLNVTAMPHKYRQMADFHHYYWGRKVAPYLTLFIGGNHEASNHLWELYYGGWAAPNIYYIGAANVVQVGPLKIAGLSGIWKGYDYRKPHFERLPYNYEDMRSIYHVRELDARKLLSYRSQVDIGLSHDWPKGIEWLGDHEKLFRIKDRLEADALSGKLGNTAASQILDHLRPPLWFSAHLHTRFTAQKVHASSGVRTEVSVEQIAPATENRNQAQPETKQIAAEQSISAWKNFQDTVQAEEAAETEIASRIQRENREQSEINGVPLASKVNYQETYKKVKLENGFGRSIATVTDSESAAQPAQTQTLPQLDGCCGSITSKRRRMPSSPMNEQSPSTQDLVSDIDQVPDANGPSEPQQATNLNPDAIDIDMSDDTGDEADSRLPAEVYTKPSSQSPSPEAEKPDGPSATGVSDEMRAQLAALSTKFTNEPEVTFALPHPENITNKVTNFLALSKCEPGREFLQLLEVNPHSSDDQSSPGFKLRYDPEWLAILRTFASELDLAADGRDKIIPIHRGDTYYREQILKEEQWVKEHIVDKELLLIPENFSVTIPWSDSDIEIAPSVLPDEGTNPQTTAFCSLIGIDNLFADDVERKARQEAGPAPSTRSYDDEPGRGGRGSHRGRFGRGRGRGRGRGGGRGRYQSRG